MTHEGAVRAREAVRVDAVPARRQRGRRGVERLQANRARFHGGRLDAKGDPSLVMAFAVAGLLAEGEVVIEGTECLEAVWPDFFKTLHLIKENMR